MSESKPSWWRWSAQTYIIGSTFTANVSIFHSGYLFGNCPCSVKPYSRQIWRIPTINWHRTQLAIVNKSYLQGTQRSSLTSRLLSVWLAVSNAHFPVLSRKPSESVKTRISMAHISKTKTNFSKIPSKLFSGLQNLVIEANLSQRFSWPLSKIFAYFSQFLPDPSLIILISRDHGCKFWKF